MWWTNSLCTLGNEDLGTLAEFDPLTPRGGGNEKRFQYCTDPSGQEILYLRALQGHSGPNLVDPTLQDNVIANDFFGCISHVGRASNLRAIIKSRLIPGGQN